MIELGINSPAARPHGWRAGIGALLIAWLVGACATADRQKTMMVLASKLQALEYQVLATQVATQVAIASLSSDQLATQETLSQQMTSLGDEVESIPAAVTAICAIPTTVITQCDVDPPIQNIVQTIVMNDDKMVVGALERVWIDPPGAMLVARVDTGASVSSLHAGNLVEFERDGDDWVRFDLILNNEITMLERRVTRHVRVYQQADPGGTRRPVVEIRLRLGDVQDTFEFTLADREHLNFQMLLGRNFLSDMALVDVGKQFVQPQFNSNRY